MGWLDGDRPAQRPDGTWSGVGSWRGQAAVQGWAAPRPRPAVPPTPRPWTWLQVSTLAAVCVCLAAAAGLALFEANRGADLVDQPPTGQAAPADDPADGASTTAATSPVGVGAVPGDGRSVAEPPPAAGLYLDAVLTLDTGHGSALFTLTGRLPHGPEGDDLVALLDAAYAPFAEIDVERVAAGPEPWMEAAGSIIPLLGTLDSSAVSISSDGLVVEGSASRTALDRFLISGVVAAGDLRFDTSGLVATELREPSYAATTSRGVITLSGEFPSRAMADPIVAAARDSYGAGNVIDDITVTPEVHAKFWMVTIPAGLTRLAHYPSYRFAISDGTVVAELQSDSEFASSSAELGPDAATIIGLWYVVLVRAPRSTLVVRGHTDDVGQPTDNAVLGLARARAYVDALVEMGIDPDRLRAEGVGESEPLVVSDSPDARARNRRVEFIFQ